VGTYIDIVGGGGSADAGVNLSIVRKRRNQRSEGELGVLADIDMSTDWEDGEKKEGEIRVWTS